MYVMIDKSFIFEQIAGERAMTELKYLYRNAQKSRELVLPITCADLVRYGRSSDRIAVAKAPIQLGGFV
jgi:hypothetical protein